MKFCLSSLAVVCFLSGSISVTMANESSHKVVRNDRVSINKSFQPMDINPFVDSKRVIRTDRVSYQLPKVDTETKTIEDKPMIQNDRIIIQKPVNVS